MKPRTKVVIVATTAILSLAGIAHTLASNHRLNTALRNNAESRQGAGTQSLPSLYDKLRSMSEAMINLCTNPSIDSAYAANAKSHEALLLLVYNSKRPYDERLMWIDMYVEDADTILSGLKRVKGHDKDIQMYIDSLEWRIKVAKSLGDPNNDDMGETRYLLWERTQYRNDPKFRELINDVLK